MLIESLTAKKKLKTANDALDDAMVDNRITSFKNNDTVVSANDNSKTMKKKELAEKKLGEKPSIHKRLHTLHGSIRERSLSPSTHSNISVFRKRKCRSESPHVENLQSHPSDHNKFERQSRQRGRDFLNKSESKHINTPSPLSKNVHSESISDFTPTPLSSRVLRTHLGVSPVIKPKVTNNQTVSSSNSNVLSTTSGLFSNSEASASSSDSGSIDKEVPIDKKAVKAKPGRPSSPKKVPNITEDKKMEIGLYQVKTRCSYQKTALLFTNKWNHHISVPIVKDAKRWYLYKQKNSGKFIERNVLIYK